MGGGGFEVLLVAAEIGSGSMVELGDTEFLARKAGCFEVRMARPAVGLIAIAVVWAEVEAVGVGAAAEFMV